MNAWILTCRACRAPLSLAVTEIDGLVDPARLGPGEDVVAPGCLWPAAPGYAELPVARAGDLMVARRDLPLAVSRGDHGCCGPSGLDGPNLHCPACDVAFATEMGDCWAPHVVAVDPRRVDRVAAAPRVRVYRYADAGGPWSFAAWLHERLDAEDWYGLELDRLAVAWAAAAPTPVVVVWVDADRDEAAGTPVAALVAALAGAPITVLRARSAPPSP